MPCVFVLAGSAPTCRNVSSDASLQRQTFEIVRSFLSYLVGSAGREVIAMLLKEQEKTLRKYLLGDLSDEEQEALELWLMSEEDAYDLISAAEDDLIDESIAGTLSSRDLERFNNHF